MAEGDQNWEILLIGDQAEVGYRFLEVMGIGLVVPRRNYLGHRAVPAVDPEHIRGYLVHLEDLLAQEARHHRGWPEFDPSVGAWILVVRFRPRRRPPPAPIQRKAEQGIHLAQMPSPGTWIGSILTGPG